MAENEDWWYFCSNPDTGDYYIEHEWSYVKINGLTSDSGTAKLNADTYDGRGSERVAELVRQFLEQEKS